MVLLQLFIINRSGGLVFNKVATPLLTSSLLLFPLDLSGLTHRPQNLSINAPNLNINEWLRLGSTFHGLHAIASQVLIVIPFSAQPSPSLVGRSDLLPWD
jgi:hypothetical protein